MCYGYADEHLSSTSNASFASKEGTCSVVKSVV